MPLLETSSVWKPVPPGLAYMSPSSAFGSGLGFGIELMSAAPHVVASSMRRESAPPDGAPHVAPPSVLSLGDPPPVCAPDQNAVRGVWIWKTAQYVWPAVSGAGSPKSKSGVSVEHVGTASEVSSNVIGVPSAISNWGCPVAGLFV